MNLNYIGWLICFMLLFSCKKDPCQITRYDLAYNYYVNKNGQRVSSFVLWKIPPTPSSPIPPEVKDSLDKLRQLGYELIPPPTNYVVYEYADCDECEKLKNSNIAKYDCKKKD